MLQTTPVAFFYEIHTSVNACVYKIEQTQFGIIDQDIQCVQEKLCFFQIHCNPSLELKRATHQCKRLQCTPIGSPFFVEQIGAQCWLVLGWLVARLVYHNLPKWQEVTLPCCLFNF